MALLVVTVSSFCALCAQPFAQITLVTIQATGRCADERVDPGAAGRKACVKGC